MSSLSDKEKEEVFQRNWYAVLECSKDSTKKDIEKSARKLFLKYHPDKTSDAGAPEKFLLVQKAKEILLDDTKRREIDQHVEKIVKRKEFEEKRNNNMDVNRKRMRDQLNQRVNEASMESTKKSVPLEEELRAAESKKNEKIIKEMRERNMDFMQRAGEEHQEEMREKEKIFLQKKSSFTADGVDSSYSVASQVKVKWKRSKAHTLGKDELMKIFDIFGDIKDVKFTGVKGTQGTIIFATDAAAASAIKAYPNSDEYRVAYVSESLNFEEGEKADVAAAAGAPPSFSSFASSGAGAFKLNANSGSGISSKYPGLFSEMERTAEMQFFKATMEGSGSGSGSGGSGSGGGGNDGPKANGATGGQTIDAASFKVDPKTLLEKEGDILKKMMEAKAAKKKKKGLKDQPAPAINTTAATDQGDKGDSAASEPPPAPVEMETENPSEVPVPAPAPAPVPVPVPVPAPAMSAVA